MTRRAPRPRARGRAAARAGPRRARRRPEPRDRRPAAADRRVGARRTARPATSSPRSSRCTATASSACRSASCAACAPATRPRPRTARPSVPVGPQLLGRVLDGLGRPIDGGPSLHHVPRVSVDHAAPHPLTRRMIREAAPARRARARHARPVRARATHGHLRRFRRRKVDAALDDHARHRSDRDRARARRRTWPRGARVHRERPRARRSGPLGRRRRDLRRARARSPARRVHRDAHRRVVPRRGPRRAAADGQPHPLRDGAARGRPVGRRAARDPWLPAVGVRDAAAAARARRRVRHRQHHRPLHRARRGRRHARPDRRRDPRHPRRAHRARRARSRPSGHFPSIDVLESISRVGPAVTTTEQRAAATEMRRLLAAYREAKDLIEIGAYVAGTNPLVDRAIQLREAMDGFLRQDLHETTPAPDAWAWLERLVGGASG